MPNYVKLEEDLLSRPEHALAAASRRPAIEALDDTALVKLISDLEVARDAAGAPGAGEGVSRADLLAAALRRAHNERRKRGMKPAGRPAATGTGSTSTPAGAGAKKRAPRAANPTRRKSAGRKSAEARKTDQRTGSRRVAKAPAKPAIARAEAARIVETPGTEPPAPAAETEQLVAAEAKAMRKAAKEAERAARKAAKEADRAAKKAERKATKDAEKAARKAAAKADKDKKPKKEKSGKKSDAGAKKKKKKA